MQQREIPDNAPDGARARVPDAPSVLVVDDDRDIRESLAEILQHAGYRVDTAGSGSEALERLVADPGYDAVLSDIRMPGMSGMEFYRRLRELRPGLAGRFIVVTSDHLSGEVRAFLDETQVPFIEKPFPPAEVKRLVAETTGRREG
jgi:two-component system NtrC family sensor kinase